MRENFYRDLDSVIQSISKRNFLTIVGDFNGKTGSGYEHCRENMGKFGKGEMNSNGEYLLELAARHDLVLTNTLFEHKKAHRTTWESPDKTKGKIIRNQIDYILVRNFHKIFIQDSRLYAGTMTFSDHRLVMAKFKINWIRKTPGKVVSKKYDIEKLKNPEYRNKYQIRVKEILSKLKAKNEQERWDNIVQACHDATEEVLGKIKPVKAGKAIDDPEVKKLSEEQKKLRLDMNSMDDLNVRKEFQKKRNEKLREVRVKSKRLKRKE